MSIAGLKNRSSYKIFLVIAIFILINTISSKNHIDADLTEENVYSLSSGTKNLLKILKNQTEIRFFYSRINWEKDSGCIKDYIFRVKRLLDSYEYYSGGKIKLTIINPKLNSSLEQLALKYGVKTVSSNGRKFYFGAAFIGQSGTKSISYFDCKKWEHLELEISKILLELNSAKQINVGVISSSPLFITDGSSDDFKESQKGWFFLEYLSKYFNIRNLDENVNQIDSDISVLLIIHPKNLLDKSLFAIDQFLLSGGSLMVFVDPLSKIDLFATSSFNLEKGIKIDFTSDLQVLFNSWGVDYNSSLMVGDPNNATLVDNIGEKVKSPFTITLGENNFSSLLQISRGLQRMSYIEGGFFTRSPMSQYSFRPLIQTSAGSGYLEAKLANYLSHSALNKRLKTDNQQRILAGILTGNFKTAFPVKTDWNYDLSQDMLYDSQGKGCVILMGDVDFLHDNYAFTKSHSNSIVKMQHANDNVEFVKNSIEYLGLNQFFGSIRTVKRIKRDFERVLALKEEAQIIWRTKEENLLNDLSLLEKKIKNAKSKLKNSSEAYLDLNIRSEIQSFYEEEAMIRRRLSHVRGNIILNVKALKWKIVIINMLAIPILIVLGLFVFGSRFL